MKSKLIFIVFCLLLCAVFINCATTKQKAETGSISDVELPEYEWVNYTVHEGDSISSIAKKFNVNIEAIILSNNLTNARELVTGQELRIPTHTNNNHLQSMQKASNAVSEDKNKLIPDIDRQFCIPVNPAIISQGFGWQKSEFDDTRINHLGIDLNGNKGMTVMAAMDGTVFMIGYSYYYGQYVVLNHKDDYQTFYAHLSIISVNQGDTVTKGMKIGELGNTGFSVSPHLHFGVFKYKQAVDPLARIK